MLHDPHVEVCACVYVPASWKLLSGTGGANNNQQFPMGSNPNRKICFPGMNIWRDLKRKLMRIFGASLDSL